MSLVDEEDDQGLESTESGGPQPAVEGAVERRKEMQQGAQHVANGVAESGPSEPNGKS